MYSRDLWQRLGHHRIFEPLAIFMAYGLLVILMTWPVVAHLNTDLIGSGSDLWSHQWTFNWIKQALLTGQNPYYTHFIFYPDGVSLTSHNIAWLNILLWLPLQTVLGATAAFNITMLAILAFNGWATYWLAREWVNRPAAFIAGLIVSFWPYLLSQHDHPNMIFVGWVPLALLFMKRALENGRTRDALLAGLCIALIGWVRWQILIMAACLIAPYLFYLLMTTRRQGWWQQVLLMGGVAGLLLLPIGLPVAIAQLSREHPEDIFTDQSEERQTDLWGYLAPSFYHPLWGQGIFKTADSLYSDYQTVIPRTPFLGFTTLILAVMGLVRRRREGWIWGVTAVILILFALGPLLKINNQTYPAVPMPYRLVEDIFFIRILRQPARFNILLAVPVALLAALGVASIKRWRWTAVPLALLILAEYLALPFPHTAVHTPAWFTQLAQEEGDFAIWNMPFHLYSYNKAYMFQQVTHGQPIVNGKVARVPREALAFVQSTPFLDELYHNQLNPQQIDVSHQLQTLAAAHVRYIVIHKAFVSPTELAQWRDWFAIPPTHEDEELVVYGTDLQNGRDFTPVDTLTNEIHLVTATILADTTSTQGLVQVNAVWTATAVPATDNNLCLQLQQGSHIAYRHCTPIAPTWPTSQWQANEVVRGHYAFQLDGSLDAGDYDVVLQLVDDEATAVGSPAPIGQLSLYPLDLPVQWADLITLQEVALTSTPESLELSLHWQALQKMDTSYKIFVHLLDATTGELVAQIDTFPVGWTYLTNAWQVGEQVEDHISLPLVDALPGQYQVVIGFYDEATGERLSAPFANDGVPLTYYGR